MDYRKQWRNLRHKDLCQRWLVLDIFLLVQTLLSFFLLVWFAFAFVFCVESDVVLFFWLTSVIRHKSRIAFPR